MSRKFEDVVDLDLELQEEIWRHSPGGKEYDLRFVQVGEGKCLIHSPFKTRGAKFLTFEVREDDIWVCGMPRSGTILTEEMIWLIVNDLDFEKGERLDLLRVPLFELGGISFNEQMIIDAFCSPDVPKAHSDFLKVRLQMLQTLKYMKERRVIKSHLHFSQLPPEIFSKGCRVVYLARNPKDVMVSFYNFQKKAPQHFQFTGNFREYVSLYKRGLIMYTPYFSHIKQAWLKRWFPNFRFLFYEDMTHDLKGAVAEMCEFLQKPLRNDQIENLAEALNIYRFREFVGLKNIGIDVVKSGKIGGWSDYFDPELLEDTDKWIEENCKDIGIQYPVC